MTINVKTLLLIVLAALLATVVLGSKVFLFIALAVCAAAVCFAVWAVRLHRTMNLPNDDDTGER